MMIKQSPYHDRRRSQKSQSLVEFALALPVFLLVVFGIIEFARLIAVYSAVYSASREAARYGASVGNNAAGIPRYRDCTGMREAARRVGFFAGLENVDITISFRNPDSSTGNCTSYDTFPPELGTQVVVRVERTYEPILGIVPALPVSSTTSRTIIREVYVVGTLPPSPTPSPTPTFTPSPTLTFTPTVESCSVLSPRQRTKSGSSFTVQVQNTSNTARFTLDSVYARWATIAPSVSRWQSIYFEGTKVAENTAGWPSGEIVPASGAINNNGRFNTTLNFDNSVFIENQTWVILRFRSNSTGQICVVTFAP